MNDINDMLLRIRDLPIDPRLAEIDDAVLDGLAARDRAEFSARGLAMVAGLSLVIGLAGSLVPQPSSASPTALVASTALAPSTLLGGGE